jgi:hypothetical protein
MIEQTEKKSTDMQDILKEYRTLAAQLGQVMYEAEIKKNDLMKKMIELNEKAISLEPTHEKN